MPRVLVVDDEPDVLFLLRILLESSGFDVVTARDGLEALEACNGGGVDVVVTDLMMPRMDGNALIKALRAAEATAAIPILVVSARPDAVEGADAILPKPFPTQELVDRTRALAGD